MNEASLNAIEPTPAATEPPPQASESGLGRRHAIMIFAPVAIAVLAAVTERGFFLHALQANPALNVLILGMMIWGISTMVGHLWRLQVEQRIFDEGLDWLRRGTWNGHQDPRFGPRVCVSVMLERLRKLGLGHQIYVHASAMDPELDALEHALLKRQDLSQFLVGLMVGLGLLGTFVGLLQTLVKTSELIGQIGGSVSGDDMAASFSKIVGGLQQPLSAMGTAFSASMFGLTGSILLGFQLVGVRKATSDVVEHVRGEVLSLAEATKLPEKVEITERFLATILADILEQHRSSSTGLANVVQQLDRMVPQIQSLANRSGDLLQQLQIQGKTLERTGEALTASADIAAVVGNLAKSVEAVAREAAGSNRNFRAIMPAVQQQQLAVASDLKTAIAKTETAIVRTETAIGKTETAIAKTDAQAEAIAELKSMQTLLRDDLQRQSLHRQPLPAQSTVHRLIDAALGTRNRQKPPPEKSE